MKKFTVVIILALAAFISCKKTDTGLYEPGVIGSWHLISFGSILLPQTPADSIVTTFQLSGKYISTSNATVTEKGSYKVTEQKNSSAGDEQIINFSPETGDDHQAYLYLSNDTLRLTHIVISTDGVFSLYKRQD